MLVWGWWAARMAAWAGAAAWQADRLVSRCAVTADALHAVPSCSAAIAPERPHRLRLRLPTPPGRRRARTEAAGTGVAGARLPWSVAASVEREPEVPAWLVVAAPACAPLWCVRGGCSVAAAARPAPCARLSCAAPKCAALNCAGLRGNGCRRCDRSGSEPSGPGRPRPKRRPRPTETVVVATSVAAACVAESAVAACVAEPASAESTVDESAVSESASGCGLLISACGAVRRFGICRPRLRCLRLRGAVRGILVPDCFRVGTRGRARASSRLGGRADLRAFAAFAPARSRWTGAASSSLWAAVVVAASVRA